MFRMKNLERIGLKGTFEQMTFPIIDLHCDLLLYLIGNPQRTPYDLAARCAVPQLLQGNVKVQTLAVFTETEPHSVQKALQQLHIYQQLPAFYPKDFKYAFTSDAHSPAVGIMMGIENASGFCGETESLVEGMKRLNSIITDIAKPLYMSLTWNSENRFGGGALTSVGIKPDGKHLLEELHQKKIAVDLSHASDALAYDIIDYIEGRNLDIPLMASHSNARAVAKAPRNLPDELALEIFRRNGVVGLNFCRKFLGENEDSIPRHLLHWLELGGENHITMGADFFYEEDLPISSREGKTIFFPNYQNASCYVRLMDLLQKEFGLPGSILEKLAHKNARAFIGNLA